VESPTAEEYGDLRRMTLRLDEEVAALKGEVAGLTKVAAGQAAMIGLLAGMLSQHGHLTRDEAALVAVAGVEAQEHEGLTAQDVGNWIHNQIKSAGRPKKDRRRRRKG